MYKKRFIRPSGITSANSFASPQANVSATSVRNGRAITAITVWMGVS